MRPRAFMQTYSGMHAQGMADRYSEAQLGRAKYIHRHACSSARSGTGTGNQAGGSGSLGWKCWQVHGGVPVRHVHGARYGGDMHDASGTVMVTCGTSACISSHTGRSGVVRRAEHNMSAGQQG